MRILALDVGDKRIGVAVSDALGITAQGVETIYTCGLARDIGRVCELLTKYETNRVLVGDPLRLSGAAGTQAEKARAFAKELGDRGYDVRMSDERLTSVSAEKTLIEAGVRREKRKTVIDMLAAGYILQSYLDSGGWERNHAPTDERGANIGKEVYRLMDGYMEQDNIVELIDEDGKELQFQHLMTLEYNQKSYVVLAAVEPSEDIAEDEAVILRIEQDEDQNDVYSTIEDEDELEKVFERYLEIAENDEDDSDEADDSDDE